MTTGETPGRGRAGQKASGRALPEPGTAQLAKQILISLVAPCYNEASCIEPFLSAVNAVFANLGYDLEIVFVNDGSSDATLGELLRWQERDERIVVVDLSRNFGKEAALTAGIEAARGDAVIPLDVDLQDPPELIPQMIAKWRDGYDVVLPRRVNRDADSFFKRVSARLFYRTHNSFARPAIPENVGDFRLMDRKVVEALRHFPESCRFMKGIFAWLGFRATAINYARPARYSGQSKFRAWKLWNFALDGITSFSTAPLRVWSYIGLFFALLAFVYGSFIFLRTMIFGVDVPGYASLLVAVVFFGGLQLMGIGIIGEYLGRAYMESKRRPVYIVRAIHRGGAK